MKTYCYKPRDQLRIYSLISGRAVVGLLFMNYNVGNNKLFARAVEVMMKITGNQLDRAVAADILSRDQADKLVTFLRAQPVTGPRFDFTHILYYLGGMLAIGAMTLFMNLGWETFGGWGIVLIALLYAVAGLKLTTYFQAKGLAVPAGICAAFVTALTPLAIYGLQQALGMWPEHTAYKDYHHYIRWHWLYMELGTLAVGAVMAWKYRYPFLLMPVAATLWYMSMDLAPLLHEGKYDFEFKALVSMWFGAVNILLAFWVDIRSRRSGDYAFWLYLFGIMAFWGGLTSQHSDSEYAKFFYCLLNLGLIGIGVVLVRRVFVVFGALGCSLYIGHLASTVFKDSWFFPISLTFIGLGVVFVGVWWQKNERKITSKVHGVLPAALSDLLEQRGS